MTKAKINRLYLIPILSKAMDILELLETEKKALTLEDIFQRVHISKTSVYRILKTFVHRGYLAQSQDGRYRAAARPKKVRFGFASHSSVHSGRRRSADSIRFGPIAPSACSDPTL